MNAPSSWADTNRRALAASVARVRARLEGRPGTAAPADEEPPEGSALGLLVKLFGLSRFERDVLVMCAGPELDGGFPATPSFGAALAALPDPHWSALSPAGPLRAWRLVQLGEGGLTRAALRIDEAVLHMLAGLAGTDERLSAARPLPGAAVMPPSLATWAEEIAARWAAGAAASVVLQLSGRRDGGVLDAAAAAAARLGLELHAIGARALAEAGDEWARLWARDAAIFDRALLVELDGEPVPALAPTLARLHGPVILSGEAPVDLPGVAIARLDAPRPTGGEQVALWTAALGEGADLQAVHRIVTHFDLGPAEIAGISAVAQAGGDADRPDGDRLWRAARAFRRGAVPGVRAVEPAARLADLALEPAAAQVLHDLLAQVRGRRRVHDEWGFAGHGRRNLGVTALFHGPSGTGKTLAGEALAGELGLELWSVDLSAVVSKYIGETERNLRRVFDAAEAGGAVLLFDEADALFGRRSDVRDSHDRYANQEVSYLLQRMEQSTGLVLLTTNLKSAIDTAFLRRFRFLLEFPHPGPDERARIWRTVLPKAAPCEGLDFGRLAQLNLTGGHIRNVALAAAFAAAADDSAIAMRHVRRAAERECRKLNRPLTPAETAGWPA